MNEKTVSKITGTAFLLIGIWSLIIGVLLILLSAQVSSALGTMGPLAAGISGYISFLWLLSVLKLIIGIVCLATGVIYLARKK